MVSESGLHPSDNTKDQKSSQDEVYAALYRYVRDNARAVQMELPISEDTFVLTARQHPNCVDSSVFASLDDHTYTEAMYWSLLNRVPIRSEWSVWEKSAKTNRHFRQEVFRRLSGGAEARTKRVRAVVRPFEGLAYVDCFQDHGIRHDAFLFNLKWAAVSFFEIVIGWMYRVYRLTLRPVRMHFRQKAKEKSENRQGGDIK